MSSYEIGKHADAADTTNLIVRIFVDQYTASSCSSITVSDKTTVSDLKKYLGKREDYPLFEMKIRIRINGSDVLEDEDVLWDLENSSLRAGTMLVHLGCFVGWDGVARGMVAMNSLGMAPFPEYTDDERRKTLGNGFVSKMSHFDSETDSLWNITRKRDRALVTSLARERMSTKIFGRS